MWWTQIVIIWTRKTQVRVPSGICFYTFLSQGWGTLKYISVTFLWSGTEIRNFLSIQFHFSSLLPFISAERLAEDSNPLLPKMSSECASEGMAVKVTWLSTVSEISFWCIFIGYHGNKWHDSLCTCIKCWMPENKFCFIILNDTRVSSDLTHMKVTHLNI